MKKRIVITGGHLTPALAVIDELQKKDSWEIFFLGRKYATEREKTPSVEAQVISDRGIWFFPITTGRFPRHFNRYALLSVFKIPLGFFQALYCLIKIRPRVILSFGGYLSVPVIFWGWVLRIPSLTHEQTTVQGLANTLNACFSRKIAFSWPQSLGKFPKRKAILTGNPIRKDIFKVNNDLVEVLDFPPDLPLVLVTGGNQGSHVINLAIGEILPRILEMTCIFHQSGHLESTGDFEFLEKARKNLPPRLKKRYHVKKYLVGEEMGTFLNKANLVISRAGANTVSEIAALGKPALLVPLPWLYRDEQTENARLLKSLGIAEILPQEELSGEALFRLCREMLDHLGEYEKNKIRAQSSVSLKAAAKIAAEIEKLA